MELIDPVVSEVPELRRVSAQLEVLLDDLTVATDEELASRGLGLFGNVAAVFLRDARDPARVVPAVERMAGLLGALQSAPGGARAVAILLSYLSFVADVDPKEVTAVLERQLPEAKELVMTWVERWQEEGRQEGWQKGRQEGRQEGRVGTLRRLLELRFGPLDATAIAQLESASDEALDRITERLLSAPSLGEVLAD